MFTYFSWPKELGLISDEPNYRWSGGRVDCPFCGVSLCGSHSRQWFVEHVIEKHSEKKIGVIECLEDNGYKFIDDQLYMIV